MPIPIDDELRAAARSTDPWCINADLHSHSAFSDGVLTPGDLVARAQRNGVELFALTDHDELAGLAQAMEAAADLKLPFIPGVEISVTWAGHTIHIVGLNVDPGNPELRDGLSRVRSGRDSRARDMAESLAKVGIAGAYEGALQHVGNPALISRTHFARFLVDSGVCESVNDVFQRYLIEGKPGFVPQRWAKLSEAVQWIHAAGGCAVLAHPGRYRIDDTSLWALINEFREAGGAAIEVVTGSHTRDQYDRFANIALEFGLRASRGSDFHGPGESRVDLGELPPLPYRVVPLWVDWPVGVPAPAGAPARGSP